MADPYVVLGVSPSVSDEELTRAYRKLAKKYHPDMNAGSRAAEQKMQEINAAYDRIKNERAGVGTSAGGSGADPFGGFGGFGDFGGFGGAYGGGGAGQNRYGGRYGRQSGGSYDPFGGFGWYDESDGAGDTGGRETESRDPVFSQVDTCIRAGFYQQALQLLFAFDDRERGAEWFYYSSLANLGVGNRVTALRHAQEAVRLEPDVTAYRSLLYQLERGAYVYRQAGASQGFEMRNLGRALLQCLFSQLLCYCFCCRPC